jgi:small-conductance mechanosensitive channel
MLRRLMRDVPIFQVRSSIASIMIGSTPVTHSTTAIQASHEMLITQRVENSSLADQKVSINSLVQVAYGTDVRALCRKIEDTVRAVPRVIGDPGPAVQLADFAADGINLNISFWIGDPENGNGNVRSDVNLAVLDLLNAEGIEIPLPQRVMHAPPAPPDASPAAAAPPAAAPGPATSP